MTPPHQLFISSLFPFNYCPINNQIQQMTSSQDLTKDLSTFKSKFSTFSQSQQCKHHNEPQTLVCIDKTCKSRGLICSLCLTITGSHKNHDSIDIYEFVAETLRTLRSDAKRNSMGKLAQEIENEYASILKILTDFHENISNIIKEYIEKKNDIHLQRQSLSNIDNSLENLRLCKFNDVNQMNESINVLISSVYLKESDNGVKKEDDAEIKMQFYLEDLTYQYSYIRKQIIDLESRIKHLLIPKPYSPTVLSTQLTFSDPRFFENSEIIYIGEIKNNQPHGKGIIYYKSAQKIIYGEFINGHISGLAELYFNKGDSYIGEFKDDKKEGRGVYRWTDTNIYEGQFKGSKRNGRGLFWWGDGSRYEGYFKDGVQCGYGVLYRANNTIEYEGSWSNGMFDGQGVQIFENGEKYEGSFREDKFHGNGIFYKNDSIIYGSWKDNELNVVNMTKSTLPNEKNVKV